MTYQECPECSCSFTRRKSGCCPYCGVPLRRVGTAWMVGEVQATKQVLDAFIESKRRLGGTIYIPRGSKFHIKQLSIARRMVNNAAEFLKQAGDDIDPVRFTVSAVRWMSTSKSTSEWFARINDLAALSGQVFWKSAPEVLAELRYERKMKALDDSAYNGYKPIEIAIWG